MRIVRLEPTSLLFAPSTVHMFDVTALPLTERSEPPSRPLSLMLTVSVDVTPGISSASCRKFLPLSGSSLTCAPVMIDETSPPIVFTETAGTSTLTDSVMAPVSSLMSISRTSATFTRIPLVADVLKPGYSTSIEYVPTGTSAKA